MIYFVYGNDAYRLKKTVDAMREKYEDSSGMNSSLFDGDYDLEKIRSDVMSLPFLAEKRLIIIKNALSTKSVDGKKVVEVLDKKPDSTVVVFIEEGEPDKRTVLFKRLAKEKSKELNILQGGELARWIKAEVEKNGGDIETSDANTLSGYFGGDLWRLKNEIEKLVAYNKEITEESIGKLCVPDVNVKIFDLTDAIAQKDKGKSSKILKELLDSGENEMYLLSMIQWQMRNLAIVYELKDSSDRDIISRAKLNPYIVKKTLSAARLLCHSREGGNPDEVGFDTIKKYYELIIEAENDIKTGAKESDIALELLVNKLVW